MKMETVNVSSYRSWKLVNIDKVILLAGIIGLTMTLCESNVSIASLSTNLDRLWELDMYGFQPEVANMIKLILWAMIVIKAITKEVYAGCYVVMIYAFTTGNKGYVYPWIAVSAIRSLFVEAVTCFMACIICAHYNGVKYACLDYVIKKGFSLSCSVFLWTTVYESYLNEIVNRECAGTSNAVSQVRSLESVLAEAVVDWFLEEAERCRTFDSKLAVDEDIVMFEKSISHRAARFLELKPNEILEDVRLKMDKNAPIPKVQTGTQTEQLNQEIELEKQTDDMFSKSGTSVGNKTMSEFDMVIKNPLRRFPYFPLNDNLVSYETSSDEYIDDTMLGNKCVSVQTLESFNDIDITPCV